MILIHRHNIRAEKEEWKKALEKNMLVKMINVMIGRKLNRTDSYLLHLVIHILNILTKPSLFSCFSFYSFTVLWKHFKLEFSLHAGRYTGGVLTVPGVGFFSQNLLNGRVLINKGSENSSLNKQVFCLYTLKSCLWKLKVILLNRVYSGSSIILTYTGYTTVMSFNN